MRAVFLNSLLMVAAASLRGSSSAVPCESNLGLNATNLHRGKVAIGFLPGFREHIAPNAAREINALLPVPLAILGDYFEIESRDLDLSLIDLKLPHILSLEGNPVWELALMPVEGLDEITPYVAERIAMKMQWINRKGITVWLRFAHEMNGDWYKWGGQPELFIKKWRMVAQAVKARTSDTYMLWAPNVAFGSSLDLTVGGYTRYWPGADTVDISGLSFYHFGGKYRLNVLPRPGEAFEKISEFSKLYGSGKNKPIVLAETSAAFTTSLSGSPTRGGASNHDIKLSWLQQVLSLKLQEYVPELKAVSWFEVIKDENAGTQGTRVRCEDFRLLLGEKRTSLDAVRYLSSGYRKNSRKGSLTI